jgi:four helix bundle protein
MDEAEFKQRTKQLALRVIKLVEALPQSTPGSVIGEHLLHSATSLGANYRAACRAKSPADMIAKLGTVEEEADETLYWLELIVEAGLMPENRLADLIKETDEILTMTVSSSKTIRDKKSKS